MGESAAPVGIVFGADVIPHLHSDGRAFVILDRVNLEPVLQGRMFDRQRRDRHPRGGRRWFARFDCSDESADNKGKSQESETVAHESPKVTAQQAESTRIWQEFQIAVSEFRLEEFARGGVPS